MNVLVALLKKKISRTYLFYLFLFPILVKMLFGIFISVWDQVSDLVIWVCRCRLEPVLGYNIVVIFNNEGIPPNVLVSA
jgi:hypothetical protein